MSSDYSMICVLRLLYTFVLKCALELIAHFLQRARALTQTEREREKHTHTHTHTHSDRQTHTLSSKRMLYACFTCFTCIPAAKRKRAACGSSVRHDLSTNTTFCRASKEPMRIRMRACVRARVCVCACVRACVRACV